MKPSLPLRPLLLGLFLFTPALCLAADEQRSRAPGAASTRAKIDLNTADRKTLEAIPVIGPTAAPAIIAARPFATLDDLDRVKGLTTEQLEQIRAISFVTPPPSKKPLGEPTTSTADKKPLGVPTHATPAPPGTEIAASSAKPDINTASESALAAVPVIGPDLARKIVAARPFSSPDDLARLRGLTTEQFEQLRGAVSFGAR